MISHCYLHRDVSTHFIYVVKISEAFKIPNRVFSVKRIDVINMPISLHHNLNILRTEIENLYKSVQLLRKKKIYISGNGRLYTFFFSYIFDGFIIISDIGWLLDRCKT